MVSARERDAMRHAIALSAFGLGTTSPNPSVGCVILDREEQLVGQGYHRCKGEAHAEVLALAQAGQQARDGTAVVTLEPCNHHGRTPPCHQALIDAGVRRVLVALLDPTSRGEGGVVLLRRAGLDVEADVLADEARLVLDPWLRTLELKRPHVHCLHIADSEPQIDTLEAVPDAASLKASHDVVLSAADGAVAEAVPGAHDTNLTLPAQLDLDEPEAALATLYRGGVRSVLLTGDEYRVRPFVHAGLIDRMTAYLPDPHPLAATPPGHAVRVLPEGFRLVAVTKLAGWVRVWARAE